MNPSHLKTLKLLTLVLCFPLLSFITLKDSATDYDKQINDVVADFKLNIFDQQKCQAASQKAAGIADNISDAINEGDLSKADLKKLEDLKKDAEAVEDYIMAVGNLDGGFETVEKFNLANNRVKGDIGSVSNGKFCVDIISVSIGDFICYLAENNNDKITSVNYSWKSPAGAKSDSGTITVFAHSIGAMYSNRKDPKTNTVEFMGLVCRSK
jgi:hypothetical protein